MRNFFLGRKQILLWSVYKIQQSLRVLLERTNLNWIKMQRGFRLFFWAADLAYTVILFWAPGARNGCLHWVIVSTHGSSRYLLGLISRPNWDRHMELLLWRRTRQRQNWWKVRTGQLFLRTNFWNWCNVCVDDLCAPHLPQVMNQNHLWDFTSSRRPKKSKSNTKHGNRANQKMKEGNFQNEVAKSLWSLIALLFVKSKSYVKLQQSPQKRFGQSHRRKIPL